MVYAKMSGELMRVWISNGKEERIGNTFPGYSDPVGVSMDGKEIYWVRQEPRSTFGLVKDVFE
jgi:hypothetical protein